MEPSTSNESAGPTRGGWRRDAGQPDLSVAVADPPPSMTAAHWANRDNDTIYRRPGQTGTFRRPPAENSFPGGSGSPADPPSSGDPDYSGAIGYSGASGYPGQAGYSRDAGDVGEAGHPADTGYSADPEPTRPIRFGAVGPGTDHQPAAASEAQSARHWTTIGTETRRPRTSDRDEVSAPARGSVRAAPDSPGAPAGSPYPPAAFQPTAPRRPGTASAGSAAIGSARAAHARPSLADNPMDIDGLLGGPIRDIRPHRANRDGGGTAKDQPATGFTRDDAPGRRRSRVVLWTVLLLAMVTVLGGGVAAVVAFSGSPDGLASVLRSSAGSDDAKSVTAPLQGRTEAAFELVTGTTQVTMRSEDLGDDLYRITSAPDSGTVPRPIVNDDRVQLHLSPDGEGTSGTVEVVLSAKVRWALRFTGGADEQRIDMRQGRIAAVDILGGARRFELGLPPATGTVNVRLSGAVDEFVLVAPKDSPVRVRVDSGANTVAAGERTLRDVKPGSTLTPKGWEVANRYDVDAAAKVTLLSIATAG